MSHRYNLGDAVVRRWNNQIYWVVADIDNGSEYLLADAPNKTFNDCKVCDLPSNLKPATPEILQTIGKRPLTGWELI